MTERTPAQLAAFERARAARQAALERKKKGKEPAPAPPVEAAPIVEAPQEEPPVPEETPVQAEPPPPVEQAPQPFEELSSKMRTNSWPPSPNSSSSNLKPWKVSEVKCKL